jgi:hypothetical protein
MKAWAVEVAGVIDIKTVSPTPRAAKVNYLNIYEFPVFMSMSDELIHLTFAKCAERTGVNLVPVEVTKMEE